MKIGVIFGTRPEAVKASPVIRELERRKIDFFILHTGQHYSYEMDKLFFEELKLPIAKYNLQCGNLDYKKQIGYMVNGIVNILKGEKPDCICVFGDTNSVLAGALAGKSNNVKVAHVEAGLRSNDLRMIEEINRIVTDNISDFLFTPTKDAKKNLEDEKINSSKIYIVGNTSVDAVLQNIEIAQINSSNLLKDLNLIKKEYVVLTMHRPENVDYREVLKNIIEGLKIIHGKFNLPIIFPIHPRTKKMLGIFDIRLPNFIKVIEPLGYLEFLYLMQNCKLLITDSGGLQEESCTLRIPCVTIRESTERPETLAVGSNVIAGTNDPKNILESFELMINKKNDWENPFGDGNAGKKIIDILFDKID